MRMWQRGWDSCSSIQPSCSNSRHMGQIVVVVGGGGGGGGPCRAFICIWSSPGTGHASPAFVVCAFGCHAMPWLCSPDSTSHQQPATMALYATQHLRHLQPPSYLVAPHLHTACAAMLSGVAQCPLPLPLPLLNTGPVQAWRGCGSHAAADSTL